jgi:hypothetical protein
MQDVEGDMMQEFVLRLVKLLLGNAWNRAAVLLVLAGIAAINGWAQYIIPPIMAAFGVVVTIPDTPPLLGFGLIACALAFLIFGRIVPERKPPELSVDDRAVLEQLRDMLADPRLAVALRELANASVDPLARFLQQTDNLYFRDPELQRSLEDLRRRTEMLRSEIVSKQALVEVAKRAPLPLMMTHFSMMLPVYWARVKLDLALDRLKALISSQKF